MIRDPLDPYASAASEDACDVADCPLPWGHATEHLPDNTCHPECEPQCPSI